MCVIIGWQKYCIIVCIFICLPSFTFSESCCQLEISHDESVYTMKISKCYKLELFFQIASFKIFIIHCVYFTHLCITIWRKELILNLSLSVSQYGVPCLISAYQNPLGSFKKEKNNLLSGQLLFQIFNQLVWRYSRSFLF